MGLLHVVAELTSADVTWEDVLGEEEYLARTWEEGEFLGAQLHDWIALWLHLHPRVIQTFAADKHSKDGEDSMGSASASALCRPCQS